MKPCRNVEILKFPLLCIGILSGSRIFTPYKLSRASVMQPVAAFALFKVTVDLRGVFWGKQYSAVCINGKYINLYIIGELI